jgi:hypothetical protein
MLADVPPELNRIWSVEFTSVALWRGRRLRTLNVLDIASHRGAGRSPEFSGEFGASDT